MCKKLWLFCVFCLVCLCGGQQAKAAAGGMAEVESLSVSIGTDGFCPSVGNYARIKSYVRASGQTVRIRLRIYNQKGRYVFQKLFDHRLGMYLDYKWNGKPSKKNEAKAAAGSYVKDGAYTVEAAVMPVNETEPSSLKTCQIIVNSNAASGSAGLSGAKTVPILTGDAKVDYMAEAIIKSAKIKESMSDDEKVRRIYHWMTAHQKHTHYSEGGKFKKYYKLASSKKKIQKYKKANDMKLKQGSLIYNYDSKLTGVAWQMERRIGECTDHAKIFKILCNHVGIESEICSGFYLNRNGSKPPHSWNLAVVDGKTYYYDVDVEIQNYGKGQGDYYWYKKTKSEAKKTHKFVSICQYR